MKQLRPSDFKLDAAAPFTPSKTLFIEGKNAITSSFQIYDVSDVASASHDELLTVVSKLSPILEIRQISWRDRTFRAVDAFGTVIASMSSPILSYGSWDIKFSNDRGSSPVSHDINMRPVGLFGRGDMFVVESQPYFWEVDEQGQSDGSGSRSGETLAMFKTSSERTRVQCARLRKRHARSLGGMLEIDASMIVTEVAVMTCVATLKRVESFRK